MLYQSFSGDAEGRSSTFTMVGGSLTAKAGPAFFITNAEGKIFLKGATINANSGILIKAAADRWGNSGSNGGTAVLSADGIKLGGDFVCDSISAIDATLKGGTVLTGKINSAALSLDSNSHWNVTGNSALTVLSKGSPLANIKGNGYTVTYKSGLEDNKWLNGKAYKLAGGGELRPR
jgi:hypothetical protein